MIESSIFVLRNTQRNGIPDTVSVYVTLINLNNISMETFHSDLFMNLFAFFSADNASDFNNSAQSISVVLSHLSLSGYAIPLEGAAVGILLFLSTPQIRN